MHTEGWLSPPVCHSIIYCSMFFSWAALSQDLLVIQMITKSKEDPSTYTPVAPAAASQQCGETDGKHVTPEELRHHELLLTAKEIRQQDKSQVGKGKYKMFTRRIFYMDICGKSELSEEEKQALCEWFSVHPPSFPTTLPAVHPAVIQGSAIKDQSASDCSEGRGETCWGSLR